MSESWMPILTAAVCSAGLLFLFLAIGLGLAAMGLIGRRRPPSPNPYEHSQPPGHDPGTTGGA